MRRILGRLAAQLPRAFLFLLRKPLLDLKLLARYDQVRIFDHVPVCLEDQRPLVGVAVFAAGDLPKAIALVHSVFGRRFLNLR